MILTIIILKYQKVFYKLMKNADIELLTIKCYNSLRSLYDKVIFIADKISWDQKFAPLFDDLIKNATIESLNKACYSYIKYQFDNNLLVMAHGWLLDAFNELKNNT